MDGQSVLANTLEGLVIFKIVKVFEIADLPLDVAHCWVSESPRVPVICWRELL